MICTDKTGTLTRNEMRVAQVQTDSGLVFVPSDLPTGETLASLSVDQSSRIRDLARLGTLCNDAHVSDGESSGDPLEIALLWFAEEAGHDLRVLREGAPRLDALPFDSRTRYMASLHATENDERLLVVKGAPERLVDMVLGGPTDSEDQRALHRVWQVAADEMASQGNRVLALAAGRVPHDWTLSEESLEQDADHYLSMGGLLGLMDPPRDEAIPAVAECLAAGVQVKMLTGDHVLTACALARRVGLANPERALTGMQMAEMSPEGLAEAVMETHVFARVSPEDKLRLVQALQTHRLVVAMTGDGVNDAPALKRADAGVAMGMKGSEAAKEAAEIVLANDNFTAIVSAVREGRTVYSNIKRVIRWTLPTNGAEALVMTMALLFGLALPLSALQVLWVNLITAVTLGIALAFEPTSPQTMRNPPRPMDEPLLSASLTWQTFFVALVSVAIVFGFFYESQAAGDALSGSQTLAVNVLVLLEATYLFFIRAEQGRHLMVGYSLRGNRPVWIAVGLVVVAQVLLCGVPGLQAVFGTEMLQALDLVYMLLAAVVFWLVLWLEREVRARLCSHRGWRFDA